MDTQTTFLERTAILGDKIGHAVQQFGRKLRAIFNKTLRPIGEFFVWIALGVVRWYRRSVWARYAYDRETGRLSPKRAGGTVLATIFTIWMIPATVQFVWQAGLMATTMRHEQIFLTNAEQLDDTGDLQSIRGCRKIPCSEGDSIYFRVQPNLLHHLYSLATRGNLFYPDYVASVVAPGVNQCEVTSYGLRLRFLMRGYNIFPDMLDATCTPYNTDKAFPAGTAAAHAPTISAGDLARRSTSSPSKN